MRCFTEKENNKGERVDLDPRPARIIYALRTCDCLLVLWLHILSACVSVCSDRKQSLSLHPLRTQAGFWELLQMTAEQKRREEGLLSLAVPDI